MVTFKPRASKTAAKEAAAIPLPKDETTPPVTKISLVEEVNADMKCSTINAKFDRALYHTKKTF